MSQNGFIVWWKRSMGFVILDFIPLLTDVHCKRSNPVPYSTLVSSISVT